MNIREDAITDEQRYTLQDGSTNLQEVQQQNLISNNRTTICNASNSLQVNSIDEDEEGNVEINASYLLCNDDGPIIEGLTSLCGLDNFDNLDMNSICENTNITTLCGEDNKLDKTKICINNT